MITFFGERRAVAAEAMVESRGKEGASKEKRTKPIYILRNLSYFGKRQGNSAAKTSRKSPHE